MSEIGKGARFDFAVLAIGFAEENGGWRLSVGYGGDVHAYTIKQIRRQRRHKIAILHAYNNDRQNRLMPSKQRDFAQNGLELRSNVSSCSPPVSNSPHSLLFRAWEWSVLSS
jgi:hypothetical protein